MRKAALQSGVMAICMLFIFLDRAYPAEVSLYLIPRFKLKGDTIELRDIAKVDVKDIDKEEVGSITIDPSMYSDNFIDRHELLELLKSRFGKSVHVYGSGVMIQKFTQEKTLTGTDSDILVKKGDKVRFSLVRGGIRVEINGEAMKDGQEGEDIPVKLKTNKTVLGKITGEREVETGL